MLDWNKKAEDQIKEVLKKPACYMIEYKMPQKMPEYIIESKNRLLYGDFSTNILFVISSILNKNVNEIYNVFQHKINIDGTYVKEYKYCCGFLNFTMKDELFFDALMDFANEDTKLKINFNINELNENNMLFDIVYVYNRTVRVFNLLKGRCSKKCISLKNKQILNESDIETIRCFMDLMRCIKWLGGKYEYRFLKYMKNLASKIYIILDSDSLRDIKDDNFYLSYLMLKASSNILCMALNYIPEKYFIGGLDL